MNPITARPATERATREQPASRPSRASHLTWIGPVVLMGALGLFEVGTPQLWRDEFATWSAATRTLPQLWAMLHHIDAVLGVYYFGLHFWIIVFGASPTSMRLPSVIAMTIAAGLVGLIGRRLAGNTAGLAGGLVFALIPSVSRYAQEARPYAFATLFATLATLMFLRAMERPSWTRWALYTVALAAAGTANLIALCIVAAHLAILLWDFLQRTVRAGGDGTPESGRSIPGLVLSQGPPLPLVRRFCVAVVASVVLVSPLALEGHRQEAGQIGPYPVPHVAELIGVSGHLWQELFASVPAAVVIMLLGVASLAAASGARRRTAAVYALLLAIAPVTAVWVISSSGPTSYWMFRYMLFSIFGWALAAGMCIAYLADRVGRSRLARLPVAVSPRYAVAAVAVVLVALASLHDQLNVRRFEAHNFWAYPEMPSNGEPVNYQGAAAIVAANERPGDAIVFQVSDQNHYEVDNSLRYYLGSKLPTVLFESQTQVQAAAEQPVACASPAACMKGTPRIWVVYVDHLATSAFTAMSLPEASYLEILGYQARQTWQKNGISVSLLTVP